MTFSNSRTFPGQGCVTNRFEGGRCNAAQSFIRPFRTRRSGRMGQQGDIIRRSRSGGINSGHRDAVVQIVRNDPFLTASRGLYWLRRNPYIDLRWRFRTHLADFPLRHGPQLFDLIESGISPISSRKSVPPLAL